MGFVPEINLFVFILLTTQSSVTTDRWLAVAERRVQADGHPWTRSTDYISRSRTSASSRSSACLSPVSLYLQSDPLEGNGRIVRVVFILVSCHNRLT